MAPHTPTRQELVDLTAEASVRIETIYTATGRTISPEERVRFVAFVFEIAMAAAGLSGQDVTAAVDGVLDHEPSGLLFVQILVDEGVLVMESVGPADARRYTVAPPRPDALALTCVLTRN